MRALARALLASTLFVCDPQLVRAQGLSSGGGLSTGPSGIALLNVQAPPYSAKGNTRTVPGSCIIASGSFVLACPSAAFSSSDLGKTILIHGAGSSGAPLQTTISAVGDATHLTLSVAASSDVPQDAVLTATVSTAQSGAGSYAPGNTITLTGGTETANAVVTAVTTQVVSASAGTNGSGCTDGTYTVTGTTGRGTLFQASVTMASNVPTVNSISRAGSYQINPTVLTNEPVTGVAG